MVGPVSNLQDSENAFTNQLNYGQDYNGEYSRDLNTLGGPPTL